MSATAPRERVSVPRDRESDDTRDAAGQNLTGKATQAACQWILANCTTIERECLELLGCYGAGQVRRFAEIVAATVLCGELSLGSAIVAEEWVSAHDLYGRNRP